MEGGAGLCVGQLILIAAGGLLIFLINMIQYPKTSSLRCR